MRKDGIRSGLVQQIDRLTQDCRRLKAAEETFHRQNESLRALHETSMRLISEIDKEELLQIVLERAASLSGTAHGFIYLKEPEDTVMQMRVGMGFFKSQLGRQVVPGEGMGGWVWKTEKPCVVDDYLSWSARIQDKVLDGISSIVGIPLKYNGGMVGVIALAHVDEKKRFSEEDVSTLEQFSALALIALQKARMYNDLQRELEGRRQTEKTLRESETRYRTFLESSPDPIVVYDMDGVATYVNPAFEQTFHLSRKELIGKTIDFVPEESWPETRAAIKRMLSGQKISLFETKRSTREGQILDVQLSSTLYSGDDGKPAGNIVTLRDISGQKETEEELAQYRGQLEKLVEERTAELAAANLKLEREVVDRTRAEKKLRRQEKERRAQSQHLEEVNTALRVLLKQREDDKAEMGQVVQQNVRELVHPYLTRILSGRLTPTQRTLAGILETNLENIMSPFVDQVTQVMGRLTPSEIRVASLVKEGKTNKEIAEILLVSKNTILFHRHKIREKLGIKNKKINLRSHLLTLESSR